MKSPSIARAERGATARLLLFATALVPVVVVPGFFFPYVTVRAVFFRVLVELATAILLYSVVRRDITFNLRRDAVFWALTAWVGANALAAAFGAAPIRSIFGDHERMGGVWFWVHLLAYYVVLRTFLRPDDWWRFFRIAVGVAATIAAYGLVQYWFHSFNFGIGGISAGVTIGNSGLLAAYLLANVALCVLLALRGGTRARAGYLAVALLLVVALVFSGNRSSTLALLVGGGVAFVSYALWSGSLRGWRGVVVAAFFASAAVLPFVTRTPWARPVTSRIPALNRLSSGVDSSRVIQWRAAVDGIRARPLLGVGPENYQIIWSRYYHPEMYRFISDSRWDRAHNAYLDAFATAGILGFLALLSVCLALGWSARQAARRSRATGDGTTPPDRSRAIEATALGFFVAYAFYLFFWFFDLNSTMLWIALAAFVASRATGTPLIKIGAPLDKRWQSTMVLGLGAIVLVSLLYVHGYATLQMARTLDRTQNRNRPLHQVLADFESVFGSPALVTQHAFIMYAGQLASLRLRFPEIKKDAASAALFDRAFILAIEEFERQAVRDPLNERITIQHARVLMLGAYYYGNSRLYESALVRLRRAVELAPQRVPAHLVLGMAYLNAQRPEKALEVFQRAYAVYPPLGQTHSYLATAYAALNDNAAAAEWLLTALRYNYLPERTLVRDVATRLAAGGQTRKAAELLRLYLQKKNGPLFTWMPAESASAASDHELAGLAADLFLKAGDLASARALQKGATILCSPTVPLTPRSYLRFQDPISPVAACLQPWRSAPSR